MTIDTTIDEILKSKRPGLWSLPPEATVFDAIDLMASHNIGALLVMEQDRLLGVVSERDYTRKVALRGRSSKETPVREIVSTPLIAVTPAHSVEDCMRLMTTHRVRHLPVMQGDEVVGIVSIGDLVNWIISAQHSAITQLEAYITGNYPG
jgi:CBS domain-containing protein